MHVNYNKEIEHKGTVGLGYGGLIWPLSKVREKTLYDSPPNTVFVLYLFYEFYIIYLPICNYVSFTLLVMMSFLIRF